jgi:hypothetical protein
VPMLILKSHSLDNFTAHVKKGKRPAGIRRRGVAGTSRMKLHRCNPTTSILPHDPGRTRRRVARSARLLVGPSGVARAESLDDLARNLGKRCAYYYYADCILIPQMERDGRG